MAFTKTATRTPTSIGKIEVRLTDLDGQASHRTIEGRAQVLDANGEVLTEWNGNLAQQLTAGQITALTGFLDALRTKAVAELLP